MCGGFHAKFQDSRTKNKKIRNLFILLDKCGKIILVCIFDNKTTPHLYASDGAL